MAEDRSLGEPDTAAKFSEDLRALRAAAGLSYRDLARGTGIPRGLLAKADGGRRAAVSLIAIAGLTVVAVVVAVVLTWGR